MSGINDPANIRRALKMVEEKLNWGNPEQWVNNNYETLSNLIFEETKISISTITLKRLFGKLKTPNSFYNPQVETKNALALFLGFKNWENFASSEIAGTHTEISKDPISENIQSGNKPKGEWLQITIALLALFGITYLVYLALPTGLPKEPTFDFSYRIKVVGNSLPRTVMYIYDFSKVKTDNIYIMNGTEKIKLDKSKNIFADLLELPDFYSIDLYIDNRKVRHNNISIKTSNWEHCVMWINQNDSKMKTHLFDIPKKSGETLHLSGAGLLPYAIDTSKYLWSEYRYFNDFKVNTDSMVIECELKNLTKKAGWNPSESGIILVGKNAHVQAAFTNTCCVKSAWVKIGNEFKKGDSYDLSMFGTNINEYQKIKLELKGGKAIFYLNDRPVYEMTYKEKLGTLKGVIMTFHGFGSVKWVQITDKNGSFYLE